MGRVETTFVSARLQPLGELPLSSLATRPAIWGLTEKGLLNCRKRKRKMLTRKNEKTIRLTLLAVVGVLVLLGGALSNTVSQASGPPTPEVRPKSDEGLPNMTTRVPVGTENDTHEDKTPNRLIHEKSPYLLQHAYNPVDWYPWGPEAFAKAREEDKPIFLSIGYSTCHWCHVMAHESFEDPEVAALMNDAFVSIKVDREERPDLDGIYMEVAVQATGSGGWPLNIIMTPDQKPFFASTYIPRETRFQRTGMLELIPRVKELWTVRREQLLESADQIVAAMQESKGDTTGQELDLEVLTQANSQLSERFDSEHGGFGDAPKFPSPHNLLFLLRYWHRTGDDKALEMVESTLQGMRRGGMYDHVGFGFHRYSTDSEWLLPHFEKMLYDQAMLALAYTEAYQATGKPEYEQTAREIFTYVLRDMTGPGGGFYSAEDADSEGEEGKFYVWPKSEIEETLGDDSEWVSDVFNLVDEGNFKDQSTGLQTGENIVHLTQPLSDGDAKRWENIRQELFAVREERVHPHKDDKVLTDWNGLMIAALAKGARAFDEPVYADAAERAAGFILKTMRDEDGRLLHRYRDGEAAILANVDDYAFLIWGLLDLYEATFEVDYLREAVALNDELLTHFWDEKNGGLYFTPDDGEALITRQKEVYDGAIPSGNSVAMQNLLRLGRITADAELDEAAAAISRAFAGSVRAVPVGHSQLLQGVDFGIGPSHEVVIAGDPDSEDTQAMLRALRSRYVPNKVVLL
jgi:uncharacterized protein YyaL (SSP411 family)